MPEREARGLRGTIWAGTEGRLAEGAACLGIGSLETSLKVQFYDPDAVARLDHYGAHYGCLLAELERQGQIDHRWAAWTVRSPEWLRLKAFWRLHPEVPDLLMVQRLHWFVQKYGSIQAAARVWNQGPNGLWTAREIRRLLISPREKKILIESSVAALEYWQRVKWIQHGILKRSRRTALGAEIKLAEGVNDENF